MLWIYKEHHLKVSNFFHLIFMNFEYVFIQKFCLPLSIGDDKHFLVEN